MNIWMIVAIVEFVFLIILLSYTYGFAMKIIKTEDSINLAVDTLENSYSKIANILERPVFFDSVEIRQVINDIYECQKAIYDIAILIGNLEEEEIKIDERKEKDEKSQQE
jgi:hypothetical protein